MNKKLINICGTSVYALSLREQEDYRKLLCGVEEKEKNLGHKVEFIKFMA